MESCFQTSRIGVGVGTDVLVGTNVSVESDRNSVVAVLVVDGLESESLLPFDNQNIMPTIPRTTSPRSPGSIQIGTPLGLEVIEGAAGLEWIA
jgi:hypothetical protein